MSKEYVKKPRLISISGSVHAGKTTISRMIAAKMPNAFYIDGDMVTAWVGEGYSGTATIDNILPEAHERLIELIKPGLRSGVDVIVDYFFSDETRRQILEALHGINFEAKWFLLKPDIEKVLQGSATRPELNEWEIERIKYHYSDQFVITELAKVIDSTDQTPEETLKEMMEGL